MAIDPLVRDIGVCVLVAGVLSVVFERLRVPTIAALLLGGAAIGPHGLSIVVTERNIATIAELGLALLLFVIGLELNPRNLRGRTLLVLGVLQVPLTFAVGLAVFYPLRETVGAHAAVYLAVTCAFSSTLLVARQLQRKLLVETSSGRLALALLIFQDVWAVVFLAIQPSFYRPDPQAVVGTLAGIVIVILVSALFARRVLPHTFRSIARRPEIVVSAALAWCFGLGLFGAYLGSIARVLGAPDLSVPLEIAALIAGASLASLPYSHDVVAKVTNLRDFFVTLFFVGLGMRIPFPYHPRILALSALVATVAVVLRLVVFVPLLYAAGVDRRKSVVTAARLAQVSEFCLVIAYLGETHGHISAEVASIIILAFVFTALTTAPLFERAERIAAAIGPLLTRIGMRAPEARPSLLDGSHAPPQLVLLGFHRLASSLLYDLARDHKDLVERTLVVDVNVAVHDAIRATGARVLYGDVSNVDLLQQAGVGRAEVIISTIPDDLLKHTTNEALALELRQLAPSAIIIVNALSLRGVRAVYNAGADYVFSWRTETARGVMQALLAALSGALPEFIDELRREGLDLPEREEVFD